MFASISHADFVDRAYEDARVLLVAVRDYIEGAGTSEGKALANEDRLRLTLEMSRLVRRLTEATAWLMLQKGVAAGEITPEDAARTAADRFEAEDDAGPDLAALARLPLAARGLIDRGRRLHAHVAQLRASLRA